MDIQLLHVLEVNIDPESNISQYSLLKHAMIVLLYSLSMNYRFNIQTMIDITKKWSVT